MKVGFIGCGNMGGALIKAASKSLDAKDIYICDRDTNKTNELCQMLGLKAVSSVQLVEESDYIFLGVKPQVMEACVAEIKDTLAKRQDRFVIVTMAAGIEIAKIQGFFGSEYPVIRIMPNTPACVGEGMILYTASGDVTDDEKEKFVDTLKFAGKMDYLNENLIDAGCAVSGCGPAFVDLFIEALSDGGVECGLPRDKAILYAAQTLYGASKLVLESGTHPAVLKDAVCSPGGSTIAGVHALEQNGFRNSAIDAVCAAFEKTKELGK